MALMVELYITPYPMENVSAKYVSSGTSIPVSEVSAYSYYYAEPTGGGLIEVSATGYEPYQIDIQTDGEYYVTLTPTTPKYVSNISDSTNTYIIKDSNAIHTEDVTSTYSPTGTDPVNGTAVASALPTVNNPTITITQGGTTKGSFTLNQSSGDTIALDATSLPSQTGNTGKFLTTNGTDASWATINASTVGALPNTTTANDIGGANKDLSNLTSTGKNLGNWSSNVSNCVIEIPQDIILSLSSGVLTLKAGSKLYVPAGFEQDGTTKKFSTYTCPSDLVIQSVGGDSTSQRVVLIDTNNYTWNYRYTPENCFSGDTAPTPSEANAVWYDTANNLIKRTSDTGNTWVVLNTSFPICIFYRVQNVGVIRIDQTFNGIGYIGNTVFALPGVACLWPNGRNSDGTLNNTLNRTSSVLTFTWSPGLWGNSFPITIGLYGIGFLGNTNTFIGGEQPSNPSAYTRWYNEKENYWYDYVTSWEKTLFAIIGYVNLSNGKIIFLKTKKCFRSLDYSDKEVISSWPMPSSKYINLTLGTSGSTYTAPANGYYVLDCPGSSSQFSVWAGNTKNNTQAWVDGRENVSGSIKWTSPPCQRGSETQIWYSNLDTSSIAGFKFIYAEGET